MQSSYPIFKLSAFSLLLLSYNASSQEQAYIWQAPNTKPSQAAHGGVGLIQTPTARMAPEGDFSVNYTDNNEYRFWSVSLQLYSWLEATARYTDVRTQLYSEDPGFSGDQTLKDKGLDVKFRLWQESQYMPEIAMGLRDFGGTGFFESEYVTLSKRYNNLDFTLGMGWGYLGSAGNTKNPFCDFKSSYCKRPRGFSGQGGKIDYQRFFKGPASLFGGVNYQTPWQPLALKLEYEGNNYSTDRAGELTQNSRWNFGATYKWQNFTFDLNYQRGDIMGFGVHYAFNMHTATQLKIKPSPITVPEDRSIIPDVIDYTVLVDNLFNNAGFVPKAMQNINNEFILHGLREGYRDDTEATERVGRAIAAQLPEDIHTIRIIEYNNSLPQVEKVIDVAAFVDATTYGSLEANVSSTYIRQQPDAAVLGLLDMPEDHGLGFGLETFWIQSFGNPEHFYMYQGGVILGSGYRFNNQFSLNGAAKVTILENFDKFNFKVDALDTPLPRVRTYIREYVTRSKVGLDNLYAHWQKELAPAFFAQAYGGYLETMYGGAGAEVLYRPVDSAFAIGFDLNYVKQRSFEDDFSFFDYTALTGHLNLYWQPSFLKDTRLTFNIGQFLAKDKGINVDFAKRFDSGIVVGAYAAITDVSSQDYGEGSFTKGFYLSIPFDFFSLRPAIGRGNIPWVPIARDGGQPLNRPVKLIDLTEGRSRFIE